MQPGAPGLETVLVIPAAGAGTRLNSDTPKVLAPVNGRPMLDYLFERYRHAVARFVLVLHPSFADRVREHVTSPAAPFDVTYALQPAPTGMLDAILLAAAALAAAPPERVWITWCDQIGVHPDTVARLSEMSAVHPEVPVVMPTARQVDPYIHLERDPDGLIAAVRQRREGDRMPAVGESDMGLFSLSADAYFEELPRFGREAGPSHGTRERNFLPFLPWLAARGENVVTFPCTNEMEALGVNTPDDRRRLADYLRGLEPR
jgi:bifunctional UDP-N-acetylglucosamine pyrophosphorylase/glucosamine-1-phosphate N-acetyltransferase